MTGSSNTNGTDLWVASKVGTRIPTSTGLQQATRFRDLIPVAGIVPLTTVDFPDRLALVVFTQGCPWRCPYCHNAAMRPIESPTDWCWQQVCDLLDRRRGFLEAVVFSGGEPTLHHGLEAALRLVRGKGFRIGLHTAGIFPERLCRLLPLLDWVGLDIKAPFDERYAGLTGDNQSAIKAGASLDLLLASEIPFQLRTTIKRDSQGEQVFEEVRQQLRRLGAPEPVKQFARVAGFVPTLDPAL